MVMFDDMLAAAVLDGLGLPVRLRPAAGGSFDVPGIFDRAHVQLGMMDGGAPVSALHAAVTVREAAFATLPAQGDAVDIATLRGAQVSIAAPPPGAVVETFAITDVQRDGAGGALLILGAWED